MIFKELTCNLWNRYERFRLDKSVTPSGLVKKLDLSTTNKTEGYEAGDTNKEKLSPQKKFSEMKKQGNMLFDA